MNGAEDQVIIRDLVASGIIGVYPQERMLPQTILLNIRLFTDLRTAGLSDQIADCIDYDNLATQLKDHAETARRFTVEALAEDLARICLQDARVRRVQVRVEKPEALANTASVGVEIVRSQEE